MSKLKELIDRLCPNGVEYNNLGNYIEIYTGNQFNKRDMNSEGSYPVINGGINPSGYIESYNEPENTISISQGFCRLRSLARCTFLGWSPLLCC